MKIKQLAIPFAVFTLASGATYLSIDNDIKESQKSEQTKKNPASLLSYLLGTTALYSLCFFAGKTYVSIAETAENKRKYKELKNEIINDETAEKRPNGTINKYIKTDKNEQFLKYQLLPDERIIIYDEPYYKAGAFTNKQVYEVQTSTELTPSGEITDCRKETTKYGTVRKYRKGILVEASYPNSELKFNNKYTYNVDKLEALVINREQFQLFSDMCYGELGSKRNEIDVKSKNIYFRCHTSPLTESYNLNDYCDNIEKFDAEAAFNKVRASMDQYIDNQKECDGLLLMLNK